MGDCIRDYYKGLLRGILGARLMLVYRVRLGN